MKLDMHYYGTYWAARMAGFGHEEAEKIAWAAQSVDELNFKTADEHRLDTDENFLITTETLAENIDDALGLKSFEDEKGEVLQMIRGIWVPFHFLPGNFRAAQRTEEGYCANSQIIENERDLHDFQLLCRTNSETVYRMLEHTAEMYMKNLKSDVGLYAIGVAMHVLADTWSHQDFVGSPASKINRVRRVVISKEKKKICEQKGHEELKEEIEENTNTLAAVSDIAGLGHGPAGHKPDIAWLKYRYEPEWWPDSDSQYMEKREANNPFRFKSALVQMIESMRYIREGISQDLTKDYKSLLEKKDDFSIRMEVAINFIESRIFSVPKPNQWEEWSAFLEEKEKKYQNYLGEPVQLKKYRFLGAFCDGDKVSEEYRKDRERVKDFMKAAKSYRDDIIGYINATMRKYASLTEDLLDLSLINKEILVETMGNGENKDEGNDFMSKLQTKCAENERRMKQRHVQERMAMKWFM